MEKNCGLRKGSWTEEEDKLLIACIQKYREGKWHLTPQRAGLNRCRESCRLRWLNYLSPSINRQIFTEDEIDTIQRFHKLVGNRWSLIAASLPGRTANDVKNLWHTHLRKNVASHTQDKKGKEEHKETMNTHSVIRPQPHSFSKNSPWLRRKHGLIANDSCCRSTTGQLATPLADANDVTVSVSTNDKNYGAKQSAMKNGATETQPCVADDVTESEWWEAVFEEKELGNEGGMDFSEVMNDHDLLMDDFSWDDNLWDSSPWDLL